MSQNPTTVAPKQGFSCFVKEKTSENVSVVEVPGFIKNVYSVETVCSFAKKRSAQKNNDVGEKVESSST